MARWGGRPSLIVGVGLLCVAAALCTVVPPRGDAIIAVSRFGNRVTLLPDRLSFSPLPLERRVTVPRRDGRAVITTSIGATAGAAAIPVRLEVAGSGRFPVSAGDVRAYGLSEAWRRWLAVRVVATPEQLRATAASSPLWHEIFPADTSRATPPDFTPVLADAWRPLGGARVVIDEPVDPELVRGFARQELARAPAAAGRLVVLGLDALDWELVDELTARGGMPNLRGLLRRGAQAVHEVPEPLISPVVWTTIATGEPPEVHGVLDFLEPDPGGGPPRPVTSASRKVPAIWEMAALARRTTAVIGWWATFPASAPPGGAVYSDRLTEQLLGLSAPTPGLADPPAAEASARALAVSASDVTAAMLAPLAEVSADEVAAARSRSDAWDEPVGGLVKLAAATGTVEKLTDRELDRGAEVVLSYLEGTDIVGHLFAPFRAPAIRGADPALVRRFGSVVDRYHGVVDAWIGHVVDRLGPGDTLVIVSDHGFAWGEERPHAPSGTHTATATLWHRPHGVFLAVGPRVRPSTSRQSLGVLDVAPSLLALAGLRPAADMSGRVPGWLLKPREADLAPVRYAALVAANRSAEVVLSPEARAEALAKLRALGYIAGPGPASTSAPSPAAAAAPTVAPAPTPAFDRAEARRLSNLAISQASAGERERAEESFKKAIAADPTFAPPYYSYSTMLRRQLRLEEADKLFWMSVRLGVQEGELSVVRLALDYQARGMPEKGRDVLAEGRRLFPESATIWLNSGVYLGDQGDLGGAVACLRRAVELAPRNPAAHRNLAVALLAVGAGDEARRELRRVIELDPSDAAARQQLETLGGREP